MNDDEPLAALWRRVTSGLLAAAVYVVAAAAVLVPPVTAAVVLGRLIGPDDPAGMFYVMAVGAFVAFWVSRLVMCALWWVRTGDWDWRRTRITRSIRAGWGGPR